MKQSILLKLLACLVSGQFQILAAAETSTAKTKRPNIVFILTDDHRWDSYGAPGLHRIRTPNLDSIAESGTRFENAFVTLAICSPSRAACLTGRYGSANGVTSVGKTPLNKGERTFAHALADAGYATGVTGKWHLKSTPQECGFQFASTCWSNGTWYDRTFSIDGEKRMMPGFVDDVAADQSIRFIDQATKARQPFVLWMCTQVPHMDHKFRWPAEQKYVDRHTKANMPLPKTWDDGLGGKPKYLKSARNRTRALEYGYDDPAKVRRHIRDYRASVEQMDAAVGRVLSELKRRQLMKDTWIIFMGDNGWFLGEHGFTSKVLAYEESMRVPMAISGPGTRPAVSDELVLNIDLTATIFELAGLDIPKRLHGRSLLPIVAGDPPDDWRLSFLYEAPTPQLGSQPLWAVRDSKWKYIQTKLDDKTTFEELYELDADAIELHNVADDPANAAVVARMKKRLFVETRRVSERQRSRPDQAQRRSGSARGPMPEQRRFAPGSGLREDGSPVIASQASRTDIHISGVYPHLTTYGVYSQNGGHYKEGHNECGIGAIVPWAGKLWMVNYAPHRPRGSEHKLFSVDADLSRPMTVHPESAGGTPAGRMIHEESSQLLIAHHLIDADGNVRTIQPADMPIRVTAIARHLKDPANMVYYIDMEGSIWEANVHTLAVKRLFKKPVPGWHGKGGYTSQGRLVISNNGELHVGNYNDVLVGGKAENKEERGVLAEFDGSQWKIVERRQFTEVTGPNGITGGSDDDDPIWTMGWDRRSVRLKVLDGGQWHTYLLPKSAYCNDASHGWYTEWPRIREITGGRWMMDMHGMFYDFPKTFSAKNSAGIMPIGSHLRYVPDFCDWNGKLVLATDETSIQGNKLAGQPQSNLWFGDYEDLKTWGPASGYGGPWIEDGIKGNVPSDPFLVAGFDRRVVHLAVGRKKPRVVKALRATDQQMITELPVQLANLPRVTVARGDWHKPAPGFTFNVDSPVTVYLAVDKRGNPKLDPEWRLTELSLKWGKGFRDRVYSRQFEAGEISIPRNTTQHTRGSFGMPHAAFVQADDEKTLTISDTGKAAVIRPTEASPKTPDDRPVTFTLEVDQRGTGKWTHHQNVTVPANGYLAHYLPNDLNATWMRFKTDRDCVATVMLHQTTSRFIDGKASQNSKLFAGLADVEDSDAIGGLLYAAKRNRNLRMIGSGDRFFEFSKSGFEFQADSEDEKLKELLHVDQEFSVDAASVVLKSEGRTYRLPKGHAAYDQPFASGWPRASREVESERHLANIHGTFYEVPLITNGSPPAWNLMRPVSSHRKQITDFCTWNGLLVLSGTKAKPADDVHIFQNPKLGTGLWFGGIDDLWKLGKPVGHGGPWLNTKVKANYASDPYLMTGYDRKSVHISHGHSQPVSITLEVDIDGKGLWVKYKTFKIPGGRITDHEFPAEFSAFWVRAISDTDTSATVQLRYR